MYNYDSTNNKEIGASSYDSDIYIKSLRKVMTHILKENHS